jgi:hypothetical protein
MTSLTMTAPSGRYVFVRVIAGALALPITVWALVGILALFRMRFDVLSTIFTLMAVTFATLLWWFALRGGDPLRRTRMLRVVLGGTLVGGVGFAVGFFGPLVWAPDANQGPLLGIFVTGPLGFSAGALAAWLLTRWPRARRAL